MNGTLAVAGEESVAQEIQEGSAPDRAEDFDR